MADALDLAYAILGSGVAIAGANFTGNEQSAAVFDATDRSPGVGITSGIVLSTGKVDDIYGPNDSDATSIELVNPITTIPENTSTSIAVKVANLSITDDIFGNNTTSLSGSDASSFEIKGNELYLKAGTDLNYNTKNSYSVILSVNDANINNGDSKTFNLSITPVTLPTLSIEATNATQREGDTGIKAFAFTVIRIGDTSSSYTDTNPTLVTATNLGVINERTLSILTSPDTSSFSVGTDPGSNNLVPADVDMYRFELGQAGTISLETSLPQNGAGMDTILRLFDVYGKELGGDDDTGPDFYSRLNAYLKAGTYYFGVSGYANFSYSLTSANSGVEGSNGDYAIKVAFNPNATPFVGDPNGTATGARDIGALSNFAPAGGADILSIIGPDTDLPGVDPTPENLIAVGDKDVDLIKFTVNPGLVIFQTSNYVPDYIGKFGQIRGKAYLDLLDSDGDGSFDDSIDTVLRLFDESGNELAIDDDGGEGLLSRLEYVFTTAGTYYLGVSGYGNSTYNINTLPDAVDSDLSRRPGSTGSSQLSIILQPNTAPQNPKGGGATTATDADGYIHTNLPSFNLTQTNTGSSNFISLQRNIGNDDQVAVGATDVDFVKVNFQGTGTTSRILTATARGIGTGKSAVMPRVYVFNGQGDRLSAVTSSSSTNTVQISLNPDTDYYVGVAGYGNKNFNPLIMGSGTSAETGNYTLNLSLSGSGANWAVTGSSTNQADATDFGGTLPTGTVSFAAGETSQTITVNVSGDTTVEPDEGFIVTLSNPSGATISTATATGTIQNDDAALAIASTNATQTEGSAGIKAFTFTVTRTGDTTNSSSANWTVTGFGTNQADTTDFGGTLPTGTVSFAAGETSQIMTVNVSGDTIVEPDEGFTVTLSNPTNATIITPTATGTITNDDTQVTLAVSPTSVIEDGTNNLVYTFTRTGVISNSLTVNYTIGGTATNSSDYTSVGTSVTFAPGSSTATVTVDPTSDITVESDETVELTLASGTGYTIGTTSGVTGTITNDDTQVTLAVSPTSVIEDGTNNLVYTFTRTGVISNSLTVNYTIGGTATNSSDYTSVGTSVTFAPGSSTATVTVDPTSDITVESDETVELTLASGTGYAIGTTSGVTGTITNDDTQVTLAVSPSSVTEDGSNNLVYTFTRTGVISNSLTVNYTIGGTATNGSDYNNIGTSVTFAPGSSTATVTVDPTADTTQESDETVELSLAFGTGYTIGTTSSVTGTITNDDTQVTLAVSPTSVIEDGTNNLVYTFTRTGVISNSLTVNYTIGGTATNSSDYTSVGTSVTFAPGSSTATVTVDPTSDITVESDETVELTLASGTGYAIGTTSGVTGTITNDDTQVTLAVSPSSVTEDGSNNLVYTFTRTGVISNSLTVNYTIGGTATNGSDYNNIGTSVTFAPGSSTATVTVDPTADTTQESDETVELSLAFGTGYTIGTTSSVTGTITNDNTQVTLAVSPTSVIEDGTNNLVYTFTRTGVISNSLTVNYTIGGTATNSSDYTSVGTSVTFAPGSSTATVTVDPTSDITVESDETVELTLASGTGYTIGTTSGVTGTITNDDVAAPLPTITLAVSPTSVIEDGTNNLVYTFTRTGVISNSLTVNYTIGGTATNSSDYTSVGTSVTFAPGSSTATVTVDPTADTTQESDETVELTLASGTGYAIGTTSGVTGTITNDDTQVTLAVSPSSVTEDGSNNLVYTFTRTGVISNSLTVNYTIGGTATNGSDYNNIGTSVTFAPGSSTATVTVDPTADTTQESDETVELSLAFGTGYTIGTTSSVTGTITNDDTQVTLAVSPSSVTEDGSNNLVYTFTRTGVISNSLTVNYTIGGTATNGSDYNNIGTSVTFAPGSSTATVTVDPTADTTQESDETVELSLAFGTGYTIGTTSSVTGTITNDDTQVTLAVSPTSVTEDSTNNLVYTFTRTGVISNSLTVNYTIGGTATNGSDYNNIGTSVTFAPGSSTATVTVDPTSDITVESDETVELSLAFGTGYTIGTTSGVTGTITNDDVAAPLPTITLAVSPTSVTEDSTNNLVYTFTRIGSTTNTLTINYTIGGTATNGSDYNNIGTSVTFAPGSSTATVTVDPTSDITVESDETVELSLAFGTGYTIGTTSGVTGTITNDDVAAPLPTITLAVSPTSVTEDSTNNLVYTFTRIGSTTNTLTINYTIGGTATNGSDYNNIGTSVTFAPGSSTATVTVDPTSDITVESDETVILTLASGTGYTIGTTSSVTGTIQNDDVLTFSSIIEYAPGVDISNGGLVFKANGKGTISLDANRLSTSSEVTGVKNGTRSNFNHLFGLYEVVDAQGGINTDKGILKPADSDYAFYALTTARVKDFIVQAGGSDTPSTATQLGSGVSLEGNKFYAPFVIANGGTYFPGLNGVEDFVAAENGDVNRFASAPKYVRDLVATEVGNVFNNAPRFVQEPVAYFSFGSANHDNSPHFRSYGNGVYGFEDLPATATQYSNNDFNDAVFALNLT